MDLIELKKKYNSLLERNKKAEEYFRTHTPKECMVKKFKGKTPFHDFCDIAIDLSILIMQIEAAMGQKMTHYEKINGFNI